MDDLDIVRSEGGVDRDNLIALCRRVATLITHVDSRARYAERLARKAAVAEAATRRRAEQEVIAGFQAVEDVHHVGLLLDLYRADIAANTVLGQRAQ